MQNRKVLCVIMDGVGSRDTKFGNAVKLAKTPNLDKLRQESLYLELAAHGKSVGLPSDSDIGNSEVGHNALGAGRIFDQGAKLVQNALNSGALFRSAAWKKSIAASGTLHLIGLLSDGNVHSHQVHLFSMLEKAKRDGKKRVRIHVLFDGRDVANLTAEKYTEELESIISLLSDENFDIAIASGGGRMAITMDRYEADWAMVKKGWETHVLGQGEKYLSTPDALQKMRQNGHNDDQYLPSFVIADEQGHPVGTIGSGDAVILFNFRGDRAIEISQAFEQEDFDKFDRGSRPEVFFAGMMQYDGDLQIPKHFLVSPPEIKNTLTDVLIAKSKKQFACSETQKFGHVTYFWNGNRSGYIDESLERYVEIPSDGGITFDQKPEMKAAEITQATIDAMVNQQFDFGRINYANGDMVGHTGNLEAAVKAVETVDQEIEKLVTAAKQNGYILLVTADHGNADEMFLGDESDYPGWETGSRPAPKTAHTLAPVPCYIFTPDNLGDFEVSNVEKPSLGNIANTVLTLMGLETEKEYLPSIVRLK